MKRKILATLVLALTSTTIQAADLGAKVGYSHWMPSGGADAHNAYVQFEHFIPLVPNVAVRANKLDDSDYELTTYDVYGYYEILDNDTFALDLGLGIRRLDNGELLGKKFDDNLPVANIETVLFQDSALSGYARLDYGKNNDVQTTDWEVGVRFDVVAGIKLQGGYRNYELKMQGLKDIERTTDRQGWTAGIHWEI